MKKLTDGEAQALKRMHAVFVTEVSSETLRVQLQAELRGRLLAVKQILGDLNPSCERALDLDSARVTRAYTAMLDLLKSLPQVEFGAFWEEG
jgi:hypothetical protein